MSLACEKCGEQTAVMDSRSTQRKSAVTHSKYELGMIRRRRTCANCGHRYTTFEISEAVLRQMLNAQARLRVLEDAMHGRTFSNPNLKSLPNAVNYFNENDS